MKFEEAFDKLDNQAQESIKNCKSIEEIINVFAANGIEIKPQDIQDTVSMKKGELSDEELEGVNGGLDATFLIQELFKVLFKKIKSVND